MPLRYLTKTRFQLAMQCPTKIFYDAKPEYANRKVEDSFLLSLAEGGYQVGALARCYFPGGFLVEAEDLGEALRKTEELIRQKNVVIYEAAFLFDNLYIRVDILVKRGSHLQLIEVKSKSFNPNEDSFLSQSGTISSGWQEYLYDIAFQKYVLNSALPNFMIEAYLMMADKSAYCPTDGLNQKFRIIKDSLGRKRVNITDNLNQMDLYPPILVKVKVDKYCELIYETKVKFGGEDISFIDLVKILADSYNRDQKINSYPSSACKECEFQATENDRYAGLKSGLHECWKENLGWNDKDFLEQTVLGIWNLREKSDFIQRGLIKITDVSIEDICPKDDGKPGLSASQRQWMQVKKYKNCDNSHWLDRENLSREMSKWVYPLHFIDFETSMVAIPFNKGRHPYEGIAFQFSHHIVYENGKVEHKGQYLNIEPGVFPNYEFVRNLKDELSQDNGSIFRYAPHENTYLNIIRTQLKEDQQEIPDRDDLCNFIESITKSVRSSREKWEGKRCMIDMWELVKRYYYNPETRGSNSIKYVLPAVLNSSQYLKDKYSKPIYGAKDGIQSLNFVDWKWIRFDANGKMIDPYKLLPKMFLDLTDKDNDILSEDDEIRNGGAALMAYARMQFEDMPDYERSEIIGSLLKYCELDTLAMVMIYEGWKELISN